MKRLRILVVEDDFYQAELFRQVLDAAGCDVVGPITSSRDALSIARTDRIDGALLDVRLNDDTCFPAALELEGRNIPFAFVTGYSADGRAEFRQFPAAAVLSKPINLEQLLGVVAAFRRPLSGQA